jgi:hypothetical protein
MMKSTKSSFGHRGVPLRQRGGAASYSATDGRAQTSLGDQLGRGSPRTTHATNVSAQVPDAFKKLDAARTQGGDIRKRRWGEHVKASSTAPSSLLSQ